VPSRRCLQEDQIVLMPLTGCNCRLRVDGPRLQCASGVSLTAGTTAACVPHDVRLDARAWLPHEVRTRHGHHVVHETVARAGREVEIMIFRKNRTIRMFFAARLRPYWFSRRTVFYGLIALVLIIFPPIPRRTSRRGGRARVVNQPADDSGWHVRPAGPDRHRNVYADVGRPTGACRTRARTPMCHAARHPNVWLGRHSMDA
jgi:hypothetical protein